MSSDLMLHVLHMVLVDLNSREKSNLSKTLMAGQKDPPKTV